MPPDPPRKGRATHAPFLTRPPTSQLAPTPLYRIDAQYVLKVADFGLSEAKCNKDYVRQQMTSEVKLPIKWMAPESINDGIFSEKTDVVRMWHFSDGLMAITSDCFMI